MSGERQGGRGGGRKKPTPGPLRVRRGRRLEEYADRHGPPDTSDPEVAEYLREREMLALMRAPGQVQGQIDDASGIVTITPRGKRWVGSE